MPSHPPSTLAKIHKTIVIGLSGPSSSGKTTLARHLRSIFDLTPSPPASAIKTSILHEDDFYKTDTQIPYTTLSDGRRLQDWDCAAALDLAFLDSALRYIHVHGEPPPSLFSKEDQNDVGESGVGEEVVHEQRERVRHWLQNDVTNTTTNERRIEEIRIFIIDGFLLFSDPKAASPSIPLSIIQQLDLKMFLCSTQAQTKSRRAARSGYVTLEGFWEDPPGYVDEVVWPNYAREHAWMFENGDVNGGDVQARTKGEGILFGPGNGEVEMAEVVEWAVGAILMAGVKVLEK